MHYICGYMMKKILSIQNIRCETLGTLKPLLESDGYLIEEINAQMDIIPKRSNEFAAIIILGGPMAVYDGVGYLEEEQELITDAFVHKVPLLGICLGSQLIAQSIGGRVYKGPKKEIGWSNVTVTPDGQRDLFKDIKDDTLRVFQWHGDTYDLPVTSTIMASSKLYPQAFRIGNLFGIQFHLEVTEKMIRSWSQEYKQEIEDEHLRPEELFSNRSTEIEKSKENCRVVYSNFSKVIKEN
jgi:GMP synthase (glutamine-hydrolysing)